MIAGRSVLALIPARGGSKRLPRKNVLPLAGRPLVAWSIDTALGLDCVDQVLVSTDDQEVAAAARAAGAEVPWLRPADLATDNRQFQRCNPARVARMRARRSADMT